MFIDTEKLIKDYHDIIKVKYPDLSLEELSIMCKAPFKFLKEMWKKPTLPSIRFMYFGTFVVHDGTRERTEAKLNGSKQYLRPEKIEKIEKIIELNQQQKNGEKQSNPS